MAHTNNKPDSILTTQRGSRHVTYDVEFWPVTTISFLPPKTQTDLVL